jgi:phosphoglycolate phosphatase
MKRYKYILFDLDGTLIYSHPGIFSCIRYALNELGMSEPKLEQLRKCIGPTLMYSFQNFFHLDEETARKATAKYREKYGVSGVLENEPIEGVIDLLKALKEAGYKLAMATSKPSIYSDRIAERFGFSEYFSAQVGSGIDGSLPTKASVITEAMRRLGATAEETLMVGDRKHDSEGAQENGVDCALLKVGYAEDEQEFIDAKPTYVFDGFEGLKNLLL